MTITKEQIARLRELDKAATQGEWFIQYCHIFGGELNDDSDPLADVAIAGGDTPTAQGSADGEFICRSRNLLPALLDEVERLQDSDHKLKIVLFCTKGMHVFGEQEGIDEILAGLNEWADKKALKNLAIEGTRVFDAVISFLNSRQGVDKVVAQVIESQRERILGGGE